MDQYIVYCFLGLADTEEDKIFYWRQWEHCFHLLDPILSPFAKTSLVRSDLSYEISQKALKGDPPGTRRVTFKKVPLGRLCWNYEHNQKWSQKLQENDKYTIDFLQTSIVSSNSKNHFPEIQVLITNHNFVPGAAYNQVLTVTIAESFFRTRVTESWESLMDELALTVRAVRIARTVRPWYLQRPRAGITEASCLAGARFTKRYDSLDLEDDWQTWEYLK